MAHRHARRAHGRTRNRNGADSSTFLHSTLMTAIALVTSIIVALVFAAFLTAALRSVVAQPVSMDLVFDTAATRARRGWSKFWMRDPFIQGQRERTGTP